MFELLCEFSAENKKISVQLGSSVDVKDNSYPFSDCLPNFLEIIFISIPSENLSSSNSI